MGHGVSDAHTLMSLTCGEKLELLEGNPHCNVI